METKMSLEELIHMLELMESQGRLYKAVFYHVVMEYRGYEKLYEVRCDVFFEGASPTGNPCFESYLVKDEVEFVDLEKEVRTNVIEACSEKLSNLVAFKIVGGN